MRQESTLYRIGWRNAALLLLAGLGTTIALSHPDDPKWLDRKPRFEGPGWRAVERGDAPEFSAVGVKLESWLSLPDFGSATSANDCWGYTSPSGREYAILGLSNGTAFVEVTQPANATIVAQFAGPTSTWRDMKTYQHFAYAVSEGGGGIQVFDLSDIDKGAIVQLPSVTTGGSPNTHNVAIDTESGYLYRCGGQSNGLRIYDLADPAAPEFVASWPDRYVHDAQIRTMDVPGHPNNPRQIAFCCSGLNGGSAETGIDILDVTDKDEIVLLARHAYPDAAYSHQAWLSPDNQLLYLNDELATSSHGLSSRTVIIDVSDLENPVTLDPATNDQPTITHNLYTRDQLIFAANYTSGLRVFDATDSHNPVEVGYFDTVPDSSADSFNGLWSNYPYFPSGTVIGSDIERGLFVWTIQVNQLSISLQGAAPELIDPNGDMIWFDVTELEGLLNPETVVLRYDIGEGFVEVPAQTNSEGAYEAVIPELPCGATVRWYVHAETVDGIAVRLPDEAPHDLFVSYVADAFDVLVHDDFEADNDWTTSHDGATRGFWERGVPIVDPDWVHGPLSDGDGSGSAWVTGNHTGASDVVGGSVTLTSTTWDLAGAEIEIAYWHYLKMRRDNGPEALVVEMSTEGTDGPWVEIARHDRNQGRIWQWHSISPDELHKLGIVPSANTALRFIVNDALSNTNVEAGIDGLRIRSVNCIPLVPGDVNGDGVVNVDDLLEVIANWGESGPAGDANEDGVVDVQDLLLVILNWGAGG